MNKKHLLVTFIAILVVAAGILILTPGKPDQSSKKAFTPYISAYTSGLISKQSTIRIMLMESVPGITANKMIEETVFDFKPNIKGSTYWIDNRTIEFRPEKLLPSGTEYKAEFNLGKVMEVPEDKKDFSFTFQTIEQSYEPRYKGIRAYDPKDLKHQQLLGQVITADYAKPEDLEKILTPLQDGNKLKVTWQHSSDGLTHDFTIDSVQRKEKTAEVTLEWNGSPIGADEKKKQDISIPSLSQFELIKTHVVHQPEQYVSLVFSDPIDEGQELDGLIRFEAGTSLNYVVDANEIKVYPIARQTGNNKIIVEPSVKNTLGYALDKKLTTTVSFLSQKPAVEFLGDGNILPSSEKGIILPFRAVSLSGVNVRIIKIYENNVAQFFQENQYDGNDQLKRVGRIVYHDDIELTSEKPIDYGVWNTFSLDLSKMIKTEPGALYRVQINFRKSQSLYPCNGEDEEDEEMDMSMFEVKEDKDPSDFDYWSYRGYNHYDYNDDYNWRDRDDPCKKSYYLRYRRAISKNILASNLGIIAKRGKEKDMFFAVTDLKTTKPLSNVTVEAYNYQQQLIASAQTNSDGLAKIEYNSKPFLIIAKKDNQFGYLRVDDGSSLSLSKFNVAGRETQHGLKGFIYGERGVWRPGDSIYLSFILHDENEVLPETHPVLLEVINPRGQVAERKVSTSGLNGLYTFPIATAKDAPTGNWNARIKVGGAEFNKNLKIETVKPNRLKMDLEFETDMFTSTNTSPTGTLTVKWLHGATAANMKADVKMKLTDASTTFEDFPGYHFEDPAKSFSSTERTIFDGRLDANGKGTVNARLGVQNNAPGMLRANFSIRAFEESGNFSSTQKTIPYSPYSSYVGIKVPKGSGWHGALSYDEEYSIPVVTVSENGKPVDKRNLQVEVYKIRWRWWWERNNQDNLSRYVGSSSRNILQRGTVSTTNGKGFYKFKLGERYWGRILIRVIDKESGHSTGQLAYMTYPGWNDDQMPGGASMLTFTTDKETYQAGEDVTVKMPTSKGGRALVSIENGTNILNTFWVETAEKFTQFKFKATEEMTPNVYVHISLLQPHNQTANDLPIRMYGIQPVKVEDQVTHLHPVISMPDKIEPMEDVTIEIEEKEGKEMNYTVAVVDEGLLDITAYQTPQPWSHFYARDALGVKTWDMFDYVMGAFSGELAGLYEVGGGMEMQKPEDKSANRFKPVVKFFGPFHLRKGKSNSHTFKMPNYIGSVKTMVVASHEGAFGSADQTTPVKKPLMVQSTLPRVVGPEEEITLPVTVFAMEEGVKTVRVKVETNEFLQPVNGETKTITFEKTGDQVVNFQYKIPSRLGVAKVKVTAVSGSERATSETELQVRSPNPRVTKVMDANLEAGGEFAQTAQPVGMVGTNNGMLEVSRFMPMNLEKRLKFLIRYPHGCIEQTTSSVFPQLFLDNLIKLEDEQKKEIQDNIIAGINRLKTFQLPEGGLSYWPGNSSVSHWGTNYAGHFLLEAKEKGYDVPEGLLNGFLRYQSKAARNWSSKPYYDTYRNTELVQSYRLYTLALGGEPEKGAMNRMRKMKDLNLKAKWRLAAAYQLIGKSDVAESIIKDITTEIEEYTELGYTYGSHVRDRAMILETLNLMDKTELATDLAMELGEKMGSHNWYSTQTTAYTLMALAKYLGANDPDEPLKFQYKIGTEKWKTAVTELPVAQFNIPVDQEGELTVQVKNESGNMIFARIILDGLPAVGQEQSEMNDLKMRMSYMDMDGNTIDPSSLEQGTDFLVKVTIGHPGIRNDYEELALTQIFPSGWEIHNFRLDNVSHSGSRSDKPEYQDIRDDRVYTYFDLDKNHEKTFILQLNAAYLGRFYLPAVRCEAMYDKSISAQKAGQWVEVIKPGQ